MERWQVSWGLPGTLWVWGRGAESLLPGSAQGEIGSVLGNSCLKGELKCEGQRNRVLNCGVSW